MEQISLTLERREALGKKNKALRRQGLIPVHLYGPGIEPHSLQAPARELVKVLARAGQTRPINVRISDQEQPFIAFVREVQYHYLRGEIIHVDLLRVDVTQRMRAEVPVELVGEAPALKLPRTSVAHNLFTVEVEALPMDIPQRLEADLSTLVNVDSAIHARDIKLPPNVTLVSDGDLVVARIEVAREEVPAAAAEEAPAAEAAEGEAAEAAEKEES